MPPCMVLTLIGVLVREFEMRAGVHTFLPQNLASWVQSLAFFVSDEGGHPILEQAPLRKTNNKSKASQRTREVEQMAMHYPAK